MSKTKRTIVVARNVDRPGEGLVTKFAQDVKGKTWRDDPVYFTLTEAKKIVDAATAADLDGEAVAFENYGLDTCEQAYP